MKKYILYAIISIVVFPFMMLVVPGLNIVGIFLTYPYLFPLVALSTFIDKDAWFQQQMFGIMPNGNGWIILLMILIVFGAITGCGLYKLRAYSYGKDGRPVPKFGFSGVVLVILFTLLIDFLLILSLGSKVTAIQQHAWALSKQEYVENNCRRVEEGGRHYYSCRNPDQLILDTSFEQYLE